MRKESPTYDLPININMDREERDRGGRGESGGHEISHIMRVGFKVFSRCGRTICIWK